MPTYKDYIPEGQPLDGIGDGGFLDFVPDPKAEPVAKPKEIKVVEEALEDEVFACDKCDFTSKFKLGLAGHKRSHKAK